MIPPERSERAEWARRNPEAHSVLCTPSLASYRPPCDSYLHTGVISFLMDARERSS
jgi:hypothetical protein